MDSKIFENSYVLIEKLLKKSAVEITEIVYLSLDGGNRIGPFIRKTFDKKSGLGNVYKTIYEEVDSSDLFENLPNIYSVFEQDDKLFVFEEYIDGKNLDEYISSKNYSIDTLSKIFTSLCEAVKFLHTNFSQPIIHRDIKPSNVLVTASGQVKLIDFGISRNYEKKSRADTLKFGTVGYASPEQFGYKQTDMRSDIYSLGKVLEYLCSVKNWAYHGNDNLNFNEIINKACEFDPEKRYKNVDSLLLDFSKLIKNSKNKIPNILGHIWNILLGIVVVFFVVVTFLTICDPNNVNFYMPIMQKVLYCILMIAFIFIPAWVLFSYKPSLRQIFNNLPKFKLKHYIVFALACIAGVTICALIAQLF